MFQKIKRKILRQPEQQKSVPKGEFEKVEMPGEEPTLTLEWWRASQAQYPGEGMSLALSQEISMHLAQYQRSRERNDYRGKLQSVAGLREWMEEPGHPRSARLEVLKTELDRALKTELSKMEGLESVIRTTDFNYGWLPFLMGQGQLKPLPTGSGSEAFRNRVLALNQLMMMNTGGSATFYNAVRIYNPHKISIVSGEGKARIRILNLRSARPRGKRGCCRSSRAGKGTEDELFLAIHQGLDQGQEKGRGSEVELILPERGNLPSPVEYGRMLNQAVNAVDGIWMPEEAAGEGFELVRKDQPLPMAQGFWPDEPESYQRERPRKYREDPPLDLPFLSGEELAGGWRRWSSPAVREAWPAGISASAEGRSPRA